MNTRTLPFAAAVAVAATVLCSIAVAPQSHAANIADLQEQLEDGLLARRPAEFKFIARVVKLVEQNKLPRKLVVETFQYARKKRPYPYVYFERALKIRAARIGVKL